MSDIRLWLIAYDVRDPGRLGRLHRFISGAASMVQYSVYLFEGQLPKLKKLMQSLETYIEIAEDDLRAYPVPLNPQLDTLGRGTLVEGVCLIGGAVDLLSLLKPPDPVAAVLEITEHATL